MTKVYFGNAFALQMLTAFPSHITVTEVSRDDIPADAVSVVGHPDTAAVLGVPFNRASIKLDKGDTLFVAQLMGGRLPEGTTSLPDGFSFKFLKVTVD